MKKSGVLRILTGKGKLVRILMSLIGLAIILAVVVAIIFHCLGWFGLIMLPLGGMVLLTGMLS